MLRPFDSKLEWALDANITWLGNSSTATRNKAVLDPWVLLIKPSAM
jgi:hypothetical protein